MTKILAATAWKNNAAMIAEAVVPLGYLRSQDVVLDPTYGKGGWWRQWLPDLGVLTLGPGTDFRKIDRPDESVGAIAYDAPYVCVGGRETSNIKAMYEAYGILDAPESPAEVQLLMNEGLTEMHRLVIPAATRKVHATRPNGIVLMKCKSYVWSSQLWLGVQRSIEHAEKLGFVVEDMLQFLNKGAGPQPARSRKDGRQSRQEHAVNNYSTLVVLRKPKG